MNTNYVLNWEFTNGHKWHHHFDEITEMQKYIENCALESNWNILKLSYLISSTGETVLLSKTL